MSMGWNLPDGCSPQDIDDYYGDETPRCRSCKQRKKTEVLDQDGYCRGCGREHDEEN